MNHNDNNRLNQLPQELASDLPGYVTESDRQLLRGERVDVMATAIVFGRLLRSGDGGSAGLSWIDAQLREWSTRDQQYVLECSRVLLLTCLERISERADSDPWVRHQLQEAFEGVANGENGEPDGWHGDEEVWVTDLIRSVDDAASAIVSINRLTIALQLDAPITMESELRQLFVDVRRMAEPIAALIADNVQTSALGDDLWLQRIASLSVDEWWLHPLRAARIFSAMRFGSAEFEGNVVSLRDWLLGVAQEALAAADDLPRLIARTERYALRLSDEALFVILEEPIADSATAGVRLVSSGVPAADGEDAGRYVYRFQLNHPVFDGEDAVLHLPFAGGAMTVPLRTR